MMNTCLPPPKTGEDACPTLQNSRFGDWWDRRPRLSGDFFKGSGPERGGIVVEYAIVYSAVILPLTFAIVFTAELLWVWNSVQDFTRDGARYAATHCWQGSGENVRNYMETHVPPMIDMDQFQSGGEAGIVVEYFSRDADTGTLAPFNCDGDCSVQCIPDAVTVRVQNYEFRQFMSYMGLPPVRLPDYFTSLPIESAGCDPEQGTCLP